MKTTAKVLSALLILFALFSVIPQMAVFAAGQDGITLSVETDKDSYESGQEIDVTVTVKNSNDYSIRRILPANSESDEVRRNRPDRVNDLYNRADRINDFSDRADYHN